jgi:GT2 family glycosyltransferase
MTIYILLPVYNRREITLKIVSHLQKQSYQDYKLILIDDGSTDGTADVVRQELPSVVVLKGKGNWWWAGSLQQGINYLKDNVKSLDDIVLMINDDVQFTESFLETAVEILKDKKNCFLLSQCFSMQTGACIDVGVHADFKTLSFSQAISPEEINCLSTMGLFSRMANILEVGNFYPSFLPHYLSDYEYTIRAHRRGFKLYTSPELKLWMNEETTGIRHFKELDFSLFIKRYFSKKSAVNPLYWSAFVVLTVPKLWVPYHLFKIWLGAATTIIKRFIYICLWNISAHLGLKDIL